MVLSRFNQHQVQIKRFPIEIKNLEQRPLFAKQHTTTKFTILLFIYVIYISKRLFHLYISFKNTKKLKVNLTSLTENKRSKNSTTKNWIKS